MFCRSEPPARKKTSAPRSGGRATIRGWTPAFEEAGVDTFQAFCIRRGLAVAPTLLMSSHSLSFREGVILEARFPGTPLLDSSLNRGNGSGTLLLSLEALESGWRSRRDDLGVR